MPRKPCSYYYSSISPLGFQGEEFKGDILHCEIGAGVPTDQGVHPARLLGRSIKRWPNLVRYFFLWGMKGRGFRA